jgi:ribosomal protein L17
VFSDYPHFYSLIQEGKELADPSDVEAKVLEDGSVSLPYHGELFAERVSENGEFIISQKKGDFTMFGINFVGLLKPNFLGTSFDLFNHGFEDVICNQLPDKFLPRRQRIATIQYDSNFFAEKPRSFRVSFYDFMRNDNDTVTHKFENLQPRYNEARGCYTLNFYGRVQKASARNF